MSEAINPKAFAKLFEHAELGQILVRRDRDDDDERPGVRITFDPAVDELAPCDFFMGVGGVDDDAAEQAADNLFANMTEEIAVKIVAQHVTQIKAQFGACVRFDAIKKD